MTSHIRVDEAAPSPADVLPSAPPDGAGARAYAGRLAVRVLVAAGALVLAVDEGNSTDDANAGVTLLVTESEARVLAFAAANGDLTLAIAPPESALHSPP